MAYGQVIAGSVQTDSINNSTGFILSPPSSVMRNRIINGAMVIDQRASGASSTAGNGTYTTCDRWQTQSSASSKYTVQQNAGSVTPPQGFAKYLGATSSSAYSLGSSDYFTIEQAIEGNNFYDLNWGTANAKTVTLSFWVQSSLTGTFGGAMQNYAGNRSYPFSYTISFANTWTQISITIAGDTSGTWVGASNAGAAFVYFGLGVGSTYSGTAGSWAGANYVSTTGATSVVGTSGATFYITGVQLEVGSVASSFEYRQYGQELALCQRYCQNFVSGTNGGALFPYCGTGYSTTEIDYSFIPLVPMRSVPSITATSLRSGDSVNYQTLGAATASSANGGTNIYFWFSSLSGVVQFRPYFIAASGSSTGSLLITAEL